MYKSLIFNALRVGIIFAFCQNLFSQNCEFTIDGRVLDAENRQPIPFAKIQIVEKNIGAIADENGYFSLKNCCLGEQILSASHLDCEPIFQKIDLISNLEIELLIQHHIVKLDEIVIREKTAPSTVFQSNSTVSEADLMATQGKNLAETLKNLPSVTLLQTGATISKPVIQGLHGNRIAILNNGVPLESQQWGSEHAPEIDPFAGERISVIRGAAAVRYGVGALGGAILIEPAVLRDRPGLGGGLSLGEFSNGRAINSSIFVDFFAKNNQFPLAGRFLCSWKNAGNLHAPDYFLGNSGLRELNFSTNFSLKKKKTTWLLAASRYSSIVAILKASHIGNLTDLQAALSSGTPTKNDDFFSRKINRPNQEIFHNLLKINVLRRINLFWTADFQYVFQQNNRAEFDRTRGSNSKPSIEFDLFTNAADVHFSHSRLRNWQGSTGFQVLIQQNLVSKGALIPDYFSINESIWAVENWKKTDYPIEFEIGVRGHFRQQNVERTGVFSDTLRQNLNFRTISTTAGLIFRPSANFLATLNSGFAMRPPHANELFAGGVHHGAATFEQGDPNLKTERAWNSQISIKYAQNSRFRAEFGLFSNKINDYIFLQPTGETVLTVRGAFPKYAYSQANSVLSGGDYSFSFGFFKYFSFESSGSFLRGRQIKNKVSGSKNWLPLLPSDRLTNGLKWEYFSKKPQTGNVFLKISQTAVSRQKRVGLAEFAAAPPGFLLWNFESGSTFYIKKRPVSVSFSVNNLMNKRYREYLDFFRFFADSPGRNFGFRIKTSF